MGTKGTEKVPAQEDDGEGDGEIKGGSPATLLAFAVPGYTRRQALHHPYSGSVGSYGLRDGETKEQRGEGGQRGRTPSLQRDVHR